MSYRDYTKCYDLVKETYKNMHETQNVEFVKKMKEKYNNFEYPNKNIWELFHLLNQIKDDSDPDSDLPQIVHAYQTAESIKNRYLDSNNKLKVIKIRSLFSNDDWDKIPREIRIFYNTSMYLHILYIHIKDWSWFH